MIEVQINKSARTQNKRKKSINVVLIFCPHICKKEEMGKNPNGF
jgi:hypothetical protein